MSVTTHGHSPYLVGHFLNDKTFPAPRRDVLVHAREHGAGEDMMAALQKLPDREYTSIEDLMAEVAKHSE